MGFSWTLNDHHDMHFDRGGFAFLQPDALCAGGGNKRHKIRSRALGPEQLHAGFTYSIANASQFGLNAGAGPSWGGVWLSVSLEHRLYIGGNAVRTSQRVWFIRQGVTYFPSESPPQQFTLN